MTEPAVPPKFVLECPQCDARFNLKKYVPDKKVRCRKCRAIIKIPIVYTYLSDEEKKTFALQDPQPLDPQMQQKLVEVFSLRKLIAMTLSMVVLLAGGIYVFWMKASRPPPIREAKKHERKITTAWLAQHYATFDFPMGPRFEWAYALADGKTEERKVIAQSGGPDDPPQFEVAVSHPAGSYRQTVRIETDGVFLVSEQRGSDKLSLNPPVPLMRFTETKLSSGDVWTYAGEYSREGGATESWELEFRVTTETVETGIGKKDSFRIEVRGSRGVAKVDEVQWYAPGVGLVKRVTRTGDAVEEAKLTRFKQSP